MGILLLWYLAILLSFLLSAEVYEEACLPAPSRQHSTSSVFITYCQSDSRKQLSFAFLWLLMMWLYFYVSIGHLYFFPQFPYFFASLAFLWRGWFVGASHLLRVFICHTFGGAYLMFVSCLWWLLCYRTCKCWWICQVSCLCL